MSNHIHLNHTLPLCYIVLLFPISSTGESGFQLECPINISLLSYVMMKIDCVQRELLQVPVLYSLIQSRIYQLHNSQKKDEKGAEKVNFNKLEINSEHYLSVSTEIAINQFTRIGLRECQNPAGTVEIYRHRISIFQRFLTSFRRRIKNVEISTSICGIDVEH